MRLLLHACCGPCSLEPTRLLRAAGHDLTILYANSNIAPAEEYAHRLATLRAWAEDERLPVVEGAYDPERWEAGPGRIGEAQGDPVRREARCRACYRLRLEEAATYASQAGFDGVGTTLSVSPYQYADVIRDELERAAAQAGVAAVFEDFRPFYDQATRRSRALGTVSYTHLDVYKRQASAWWRSCSTPCCWQCSAARSSRATPSTCCSTSCSAWPRWRWSRWG